MGENDAVITMGNRNYDYNAMMIMFQLLTLWAYITITADSVKVLPNFRLNRCKQTDFSSNKSNEPTLNHLPIGSQRSEHITTVN